MATATAQFINGINQLINKYNSTLSSNSKSQKASSNSLEDSMLNAILNSSPSSLKSVPVSTWKLWFTILPNLASRLAPKLDTDHIINMTNAFYASPAMGTNVSKAQLIQLIQQKGIHFIFSEYKDILNNFNTAYIAGAILSRPINEIQTISYSEWGLMRGLVDNIKNTIANLLDESRSLPVEFQNRFKTLLDTGSLQFYENPLLSEKDLRNHALNEIDKKNAYAFISLYNQFSSNMSSHIADYGALTVLYKQISKRITLFQSTQKSADADLNNSQFANFIIAAQDTPVEKNLNKEKALSLSAYENVEFSYKDFIGNDHSTSLHSDHPSTQEPNAGSSGPNGWDDLNSWVLNGPTVAGYTNATHEITNANKLNTDNSVLAEMHIRLSGTNPV